MIRISSPLAFLLLASCSGEAGAPQIEVKDAWVRPTVGAGQMTAGYATIVNSGGANDRLIGAETDAAAKVTLHSSSNKNGIARMRPLANGLPVGGGGTATLSPGGNHLMLEQLSRPLAPGQSVRLTLRFEKAGEKVVTAAVRNEPATTGHEGH
ncbi:copper chaperone PCu(A)C [Sphingomonas piscis]|uniref:Copper chaperone PCu(A)C n=1 Tax=Sphingomonas piscis TaxID=2714943 RepID=A0A6G7YN71_9SPHN|nr:copper chaperone PCu(A)C [Sphingomonas piscis]QIK78184.1 copper chaperone PCu(A)C [Sphingomonas piscis]